MVAVTSNFSEAATQLGYAQPTVTFHIQSLERELGVRLRERQRLSSTPTITEIGRRTLETPHRPPAPAPPERAVHRAVCTDPCANWPRRKSSFPTPAAPTGARRQSNAAHTNTGSKASMVWRPRRASIRAAPRSRRPCRKPSSRPSATIRADRSARSANCCKRAARRPKIACRARRSTACWPITALRA